MGFRLPGSTPMKTTIDLPDGLYREAKAMAALRGVTVKELLVRALRRELTEGLRPAATPDPAGDSEYSQARAHIESLAQRIGAATAGGPTPFDQLLVDRHGRSD